MNGSKFYPWSRLGCIESCKYVASIKFNEVILFLIFLRLFNVGKNAKYTRHRKKI